MINGTRCASCGDFVYAREISGHVDLENFVCEACREFECVEVGPGLR